MNYIDKYSNERTWHGKVTIMELFHLAMTHQNKTWTVTNTAKYFSCSIGLVSENLRLAHAIHGNHKLIHSKSRQDALRKIALVKPLPNRNGDDE